MSTPTSTILWQSYHIWAIVHIISPSETTKTRMVSGYKLSYIRTNVRYYYIRIIITRKRFNVFKYTTKRTYFRRKIQLKLLFRGILY